MAQRWLATRPPSQVVLFRRRTLAWSDGILACQAGSRAGRGRLRGHSCLCPRSRCSTERQKRLVSGPRGCTAPWCHTGRCPPHHRRRSPSPRLIWRAAAVQVRTRITIRGRPRGIIVGDRQMRYTMCLFRLRCCGRRVLGHPTRRGRYSLILRLLERRWGWPPVAPAARWESGPVPAIERPRLSAPQSAASDALTGPQAHVWCSRVLSR